MRSTKSLLVGVAAVALTAAALAATPSASAAPAPKVANAETVRALATRLGDQATAGAYLDAASGKMVVTVTDQASA